MFTLTERRMRKICATLSEFNARLERHQWIDCHDFELVLRRLLNTGYREIKDVMRQLVKQEQYARLAAYYMQFSNAPGPVAEFQEPLARLYGVRHYGSPEFASARDEYWSAISR